MFTTVYRKQGQNAQRKQDCYHICCSLTDTVICLLNFLAHHIVFNQRQNYVPTSLKLCSLWLKTELSVLTQIGFPWHSAGWMLDNWFSLMQILWNLLRAYMRFTIILRMKACFLNLLNQYSFHQYWKYVESTVCWRVGNKVHTTQHTVIISHFYSDLYTGPKYRSTPVMQKTQ